MALETTNINSTGKKDANDTPEHNPSALAYELFIALTGVISIILIAWYFTLDSASETAILVNHFDWGICVIFFADFLRCLIKAPNKRKYFFAIPSLRPKPGAEFVGWGFLDLAASIPVVEQLRFTRLARICRVIRIIRLMKGFKILIFALRGDRRVLLIVGILAVTMIGLIGSTFLVLHSESQVEAGIDGILRTADDTMWWSLSTVLTGGCEVFDPVTPGGRFGAIILKILAVTVLAAMMGLTCGWVTKILASEQSEQNSGQPTHDQQDGEQSELQQEGEQSDQGQQQESDEQKSEQVPKDGELESTDEDMNKGKDSPSEVKEEGEER